MAAKAERADGIGDSTWRRARHARCAGPRRRRPVCIPRRVADFLIAILRRRRRRRVSRRVRVSGVAYAAQTACVYRATVVPCQRVTSCHPALAAAERLSVSTAGTRLTQSAASTHTAVLAQIAALAVLTVSPAPPPPRPRSGGGVARPASVCAACILRRTSGSRLTLGAPPLPLQNAAPAEGRSNRPRGGVAGWAGQPGWGWARGHDRHGGKPAQGREPASATRGPSRVGSGGPRMLL